MQRYTQHVTTQRNARQGRPIPGRESQMTRTSDGAYAFRLDDWGRLDRFLVLGAAGGCYYASERKLVRANAAVVERCLKTDGLRTVQRIAELSDSGRVVNNDTCLFALAMAFAQGDEQTRQAAAKAASRVIRIGTHVFHFVQFIQDLGKGLGKTVRRALNRWYNGRSVENLAYQLIKYKQRDGWSHADVMRWAHIRPDSPERQQLLQWVWNGKTKPKRAGELNDNLPAQVYAAVDVHTLDLKTDFAQALRLIQEHRLPHEAIPNEMKNRVETWDALLPDMPAMALIRNLNKMTQVGLLKPGSSACSHVVQKLQDGEYLRRARVHPMSVLKALKMYARGCGETYGGREPLRWNPVAQITDALDKAFYLAFKCIEPTGKRRLLAIDVSASMAWTDSIVKDMAGLCARELAAAMAMVVMRTEANYMVTAFSEKPVVVNVSGRQRLDDVIRTINSVPAGGTNCAAPMQQALNKGWEVDCFEVLTDNETNRFNTEHPAVALNQYRQKTGIPAKLVVYGMVANNISIADPDDAGMLDVVGFDTNTPEVVAGFIREDVERKKEKQRKR